MRALRTAADLYGDVTTACLDVTRDGAQGAQEVETAWRDLRRTLSEQGAPDGVLDVLGARMMQSSGVGGEVGRVLVGHGDDIALDSWLTSGPRRHAHHGPLAHLATAARADAADVRYALVLVDHEGAGITLADSMTPGHTQLTTEGEHEVLHKVRGGGWAHRRLQSRVEDSWDRNADRVVDDLERLVADAQPDLVLLAGDEYAVGRVRETAGHETERRLRVLEHGSRAPGSASDRLDKEVELALDAWLRDRRERSLDRLRSGGGVAGLAETIEALRRSAVQTLLLTDDALTDREAWTGPAPTQLGLDADELGALGVAEPTRDSAVEVFVRAAIGQDATLETLPGPVDDLSDGVGAVLRFDTRPDRP